jgi:hypothetical protein
LTRRQYRQVSQVEPSPALDAWQARLPPLRAGMGALDGPKRVGVLWCGHPEGEAVEERGVWVCGACMKGGG